MTTSIASFRVLYPEFTSTPDAQLTAHLALAEGRVHADFGDRRDEAVYLELAVGLSDSSKGRPARRERGDTKQSVYEGRLRLLQLEASMGYRTA